MATVAETRAKGLTMGPILKEALMAGILTAVLTIEMVGIETVESGGTMSFNTRFGAVAWAVAIVLLGRAALALVRVGQPFPAIVGGLAAAVAWSAALLADDASPWASLRPFAQPLMNWTVVLLALFLAAKGMMALRHDRASVAQLADREQVMDNISARIQRAARLIGPVLVIFAIALPFISERKSVDIATLILTYVMLGWGLNIVVGLAGLLDLGYVAFYAVGAYSYGLISTQLGWNFWVCLPIAGAMAATFGVLLGFPVLRLRVGSPGTELEFAL